MKMIKEWVMELLYRIVDRLPRRPVSLHSDSMKLMENDIGVQVFHPRDLYDVARMAPNGAWIVLDNDTVIMVHKVGLQWKEGWQWKED